jgi:hypothetical protein
VKEGKKELINYITITIDADRRVFRVLLNGQTILHLGSIATVTSHHYQTMPLDNVHEHMETLLYMIEEDEKSE